MELPEKLQAFCERLIDKYGIQKIDADETLEFAVAEYRRLKNDYKTSLSDYDDDVLIWIKKACYEILDRDLLGLVGGITSYSENGYSFSSNGGILSQSLMNEVIPDVGVPE